VLHVRRQVQKHRAAHVEHRAVRLPRVRAEPAPDGLEVPAQRAERSVEGHHVNARLVEALDEDGHADERVELPRAQGNAKALPLRPRRLAVDVARRMARVREPLDGVRRLGPRLAEHQRAPRAAQAPQLGHRVAAPALVARDDHVRGHEGAHGGELAHAGPADHGVERVAERRAVAPLRRRREAEDARGGVVREDGLDGGRL
jgi:hypothetical protein